MITVVQVIRDMGVEVTNELSWSVGNRVRDLFEIRHGFLPQKELREKTDGSGGTHCFAVYPDEMRSEIEAIVRLHRTEAARQFDMFKPSPPTE
jgi:hypothetical protein